MLFAGSRTPSARSASRTAICRLGGLEYAAAELKADRDVVLAAISQDGMTLGFAAAELKADRDVV